MDQYTKLLSILSTDLKEQGFKKKGATFYLFRNNNWGLLNFQKSTSDTKENIRFTINIGVCSSVLSKFVDGFDANKNPPGMVDLCHWKARVGSLMSGRPDFWWTLNYSVPIDIITAEVINAVRNLIIPAVNDHISDEGLIKEWTEGQYMGTTLFNKYIYLTALLKMKGDERLPGAINELKMISKGKPYEFNALEHLNRLEKYS